LGSIETATAPSATAFAVNNERLATIILANTRTPIPPLLRPTVSFEDPRFRKGAEWRWRWAAVAMPDSLAFQRWDSGAIRRGQRLPVRFGIASAQIRQARENRVASAKSRRVG
jgi:hypothetical protein